MLRAVLLALVPVADFVLAPFTLVAALLLKAARRAGLERMPLSRALFLRLGVLPIRRHYYEPQFHPADLRHPRGRERELPGVDLNVAGQLALLERFDFAAELRAFPAVGGNRDDEYYYDNGWYGRGDAEFLYSLIRLVKPRRIVEAGAGFSTCLIRAALTRNERETGCACEHACIEPYERPWLEAAGVNVLRQRIEESDLRHFEALADNDILFVDSSHVLRPQGDVSFILLEILPRLEPGVYVHFHDIFTPRDYPPELVERKLLLWNEQYALEAFLTLNRDYEVVGALNWLAHRYPEKLSRCFPAFAEAAGRCEPSALWIRRRKR